MGKQLGGDAREVITALLVGLNDGVAEVRLAAVEALGALGSDTLGADAPAVRERLGAVSRDSQKAVRDAALDALKKLAPTP
jgi:HEAT repeat protein